MNIVFMLHCKNNKCMDVKWSEPLDAQFRQKRKEEKENHTKDKGMRLYLIPLIIVISNLINIIVIIS